MKALEILQKNAVLQKSVEPSYLKEAIKELQELENRSCSNCKYIKQYNEEVWECKKEVRTLYHTNYIEHDFCCNKWENKL